MKQQIEDILYKVYPSCGSATVKDWQKNQLLPRIEELEQLMCYREVASTFDAFREVYGNINYETTTTFIVRKLKSIYGFDLVLNTIEQYKNEQK